MRLPVTLCRTCNVMGKINFYYHVKSLRLWLCLFLQDGVVPQSGILGPTASEGLLNIQTLSSCSIATKCESAFKYALLVFHIAIKV